MSDPLIQHSGQSGDITSRDAAGRDIYQGLTGDQLSRVLEQQTEFLLSIVKAYEQQHREFIAEIKQLRKENDIYREGERNQRSARQEQLDKGMSALRWWLAGLTLAVVVALAVALWLAVDHFAALAVVHYWIGAGSALAYALFRGQPFRGQP